MKALVINTYGGSLLLGARAAGCDIIGTYEDSNFGSDIQAHNFPDVPLVRYRRQWPKQDLSDTIVIAHPPCSAFSVQNTVRTARGVDSDAFSCTKSVLQYAVDNKALGIAVESVMGALGGAWRIHQHYADAYGYHLYRILENGCMWGAQWRERFWVLYIKKGAARENIQLTLTPRWQTVGEAVRGHEDGPSAGNQDVLLERQKVRLIRDVGLTDREMSFLFDPQDPPHKTTSLGKVLWDMKFKRPDSKPQDRIDMFKKYIGGFSSGVVVFVDPNGLCPVLMGGSHWYMNGRNLSENAFKALMGFPTDYVFPERPRNYRSQMRIYLSKGVMPPIAQWILEQAGTHLGMMEKNRGNGMPRYEVECEPNHIADFRIHKSAWEHRERELPKLRQYDEMPAPPKGFVSAEEEEMTPEARTALVLAQDTFKSLKDGRVATETIDEHIERIEKILNPPAPEPPPLKVTKVREPKPERDVVFRATRNGEAIIEQVPGAVFDGTRIEQKRKRVYDMVGELEQKPTLNALTEMVIRDLNVLHASARWHIRENIKAGKLKETTCQTSQTLESSTPSSGLITPTPALDPEVNFQGSSSTSA